VEQRWTSAVHVFLDLVSRIACLSQFLQSRIRMAKGVNGSDAKTPVDALIDDHVAAAGYVLLHDA